MIASPTAFLLCRGLSVCAIHCIQFVAVAPKRGSTKRAAPDDDAAALASAHGAAAAAAAGLSGGDPDAVTTGAATDVGDGSSTKPKAKKVKHADANGGSSGSGPSIPRVKMACVPCAKGKARCDGHFPCERCVRLGRAKDCVPRVPAAAAHAAETHLALQQQRQQQQQQHQQQQHQQQQNAALLFALANPLAAGFVYAQGTAAAATATANGGAGAAAAAAALPPELQVQALATLFALAQGRAASMPLAIVPSAAAAAAAVAPPVAAAATPAAAPVPAPAPAPSPSGADESLVLDDAALTLPSPAVLSCGLSNGSATTGAAAAAAAAAAGAEQTPFSPSTFLSITTPGNGNGNNSDLLTLPPSPGLSLDQLLNADAVNPEGTFFAEPLGSHGPGAVVHTAANAATTVAAALQATLAGLRADEDARTAAAAAATAATAATAASAAAADGTPKAAAADGAKAASTAPTTTAPPEPVAPASAAAAAAATAEAEESERLPGPVRPPPPADADENEMLVLPSGQRVRRFMADSVALGGCATASLVCGHMRNLTRWLTPPLCASLMVTMDQWVRGMLTHTGYAAYHRLRSMVAPDEIFAVCQKYAPKFQWQWVAADTSATSTTGSTGGCVDSDRSWLSLPMAIIRHEHRDPHRFLHAAAMHADLHHLPPPTVHVAVNSAARDLLGYDTEAYIAVYGYGTTFFKLLHPAIWQVEDEFELRTVALFREWADEHARKQQQLQQQQQQQQKAKGPAHSPASAQHTPSSTVSDDSHGSSGSNGSGGSGSAGSVASSDTTSSASSASSFGGIAPELIPSVASLAVPCHPKLLPEMLRVVSSLKRNLLAAPTRFANYMFCPNCSLGAAMLGPTFQQAVTTRKPVQAEPRAAEGEDGDGDCYQPATATSATLATLRRGGPTASSTAPVYVTKKEPAAAAATAAAVATVAAATASGCGCGDSKDIKSNGNGSATSNGSECAPPAVEQTVLSGTSSPHDAFCDTFGKRVYTTMSRQRVAVRFSRAETLPPPPGGGAHTSNPFDPLQAGWVAEKTHLLHVMHRDGVTNVPVLLTTRFTLSVSPVDRMHCTRVEMVYVPILEGLL